MSLDKNTIADWFKGLQDSICSELEKCDGKAVFKEDAWQRPGGGGGRTRIIGDGDIFEKGGVNFSAVHGPLPEAIQKSFKVDESDFFATGVSIVIHPTHPFVPIIHMNVRYFEMCKRGTPEITKRWFGGGIDLTPHYVNQDDVRFFHQKLKDTCEKYHPNYYPDFKKWADDYFFIKHRDETRGVGGLFFDRLSETEDIDIADRWEFAKAVGETFIQAYIPIVEKNRKLDFSDTHKKWQLLRRGRYVEFNLVYDAGTKFGLETSGRIESILMSLPPQADWEYDFQVEQGSEEAKTLACLKKGLDWA